MTRQAYDLATHILARVQGSMDRPLDMGMVPRHGTLVLDLLRRQRQRGQSARFFEIGYGAGTLLKTVAEAGFPIAGIEVASAMRRQAVAQLGPEYEDCLHLGEFLKCKAPLADGPWSLVYWNDVFEHIPPDEIGDWLQRIHAMLAPGGQLVTVTPNWHCRPADVTAAICPPRSEAAGLHLKEYTLVEVSRLLRRAGFTLRGDSAFRRAAAGCLVRPRPDRLEASAGAGSRMAALPVRQAPMPRVRPLLHPCEQRIAARGKRRGNGLRRYLAAGNNAAAMPPQVL